jgi:hypothetical protein
VEYRPRRLVELFAKRADADYPYLRRCTDCRRVWMVVLTSGTFVGLRPATMSERTAAVLAGRVVDTLCADCC